MRLISPPRRLINSAIIEVQWLDSTNGTRQTVWHPQETVSKKCLPWAVGLSAPHQPKWAHGRRRDAGRAGEEDRWSEGEGQRRVREERAGVSGCQIVDCSICLHDVQREASWVCLLAREEMFGAQSSCQAGSYTPTPRANTFSGLFEQRNEKSQTDFCSKKFYFYYIDKKQCKICTKVSIILSFLVQLVNKSPPCHVPCTETWSVFNL